MPGRPRRLPEGCFGGSHFSGYNPRTQRPIYAKKALHLVLRSSLATGQFSMKRKELSARVWDIIVKHANQNGIQIYEYANGGNHLHLLIRVRRRDSYCRFIRSISGLIARAVKGCEKGTPLNGKFWDHRPFTRVVGFAGKQFQKVKLYLARNRLEAIGFLPYLERRYSRSPDWKAFWSHYCCFP